MRKIYLASDSKARRKLLRIFGLAFRVVPARIEEKIPSGGSYALTVKKNALAKARTAAARIKSGVVIGADTIVVQGNKVYGKPRDLDDARRMLKKLSGKSQWVYTGIALVDKDSGESTTACEKTKIYMDRISAKEIEEYFSQVSPLDKAGSFDIQGRGSFFIRRIEGCFFNVVGLPLARLYKMFKAMNIKVFCWIAAGCVCGMMLSGCMSNEYNIVTGKEDTLFYSTEREVALGKSIARQIEAQYKPVDDLLMQERLRLIGAKIAAVSDRRDIGYVFTVVDNKEINAVSLPGGYVFVYSGLIEKVSGDDELACVLAHEVGHITAKHSVKKLQAVMGYSFFRIVTAVVSKSGALQEAGDAAFTELVLGYSRQDELLADQLAARYAKLAGYDPHGMIGFLKTLEKVQRGKPLRPKTYMKTHPYAPDRIRVVKQEIGEPIGFTDYINIEEEKR